MDIKGILATPMRIALRSLGYSVQRRHGATSLDDITSRYQYRSPDGAFDYATYRRRQIEGNHKKLDKVWVKEENIQFLADYIVRTVEAPRFGLCHGTRRGNEQTWFMDALTALGYPCEVLGTEISDTATQFPHTIEWDFHEVKDEWIGACDFIYSNSFDHSYDPERCLNAWMRCLRPGGICIIEHTSGHERARSMDPFGAPVEVMPYLVLQWSSGRYAVQNLLRAPLCAEHLRYCEYLIIAHTGTGQTP